MKSTFCNSDIPRILCIICKCSITLFPAVFVLEDPGVHVCFLYSSNKVANVETSIDEIFSFSAALNIPNVHSNNYYV